MTSGCTRRRRVASQRTTSERRRLPSNDALHPSAAELSLSGRGRALALI